QPCKHIIAARLVCERNDGEQAPVIETDAVPKRKTYAQIWPAYNLAQSTEKHRFQVLLHDLCRGIEEPPADTSRRGRRPHLTCDSIFAMTFKVYGGFSSRRCSCDLADAHAKGYLVNLVPGMKVNSFFENEAFTPILMAMIVRSSLPLRAVETVFAPDSTGF